MNHNVEELLSACETHAGALSCEVVHLDAPGVLKNLQKVAPLHAMISLHGANNAYAAFAARPFALLEIKPFPMPLFFFEKYYQTAYALDTWTYGYYPGPKEHRKGRPSKEKHERKRYLRKWRNDRWYGWSKYH